MDVLIFGDGDIKTDGKLKKKNNAKGLSEEDFIKYVKENNLTTSYGYIDAIGFLSNGKKFKCSYNNMIVGVSGIVKKIEGLK